MAATIRGFLRAALLGKLAARSRFGEAHFVSRMWAKRVVGTRFLPSAGAGGGSNGCRSGSGSRDLHGPRFVRKLYIARETGLAEFVAH
jgi:hypothetical protein